MFSEPRRTQDADSKHLWRQGRGYPSASVNLLPFLAKDTLSCLLETGASEMGQMGKGEEVPKGLDKKRVSAYLSSQVGERVKRVRGYNLGTEKCDARINRILDLL